MSGNASRRRGRSRELAYRDHLRSEGYWCERIDSAADLIAAKPMQTPVLLQVKSTVSRYAHFPPEEREQLHQEAKLAGFNCALVWWPKGKGVEAAQRVASADWP